MHKKRSIFTLIIVSLFLAAATALIILVATQVVRMPKPDSAINLYQESHFRALQALNKEMP